MAEEKSYKIRGQGLGSINWMCLEINRKKVMNNVRKSDSERKYKSSRNKPE